MQEPQFDSWVGRIPWRKYRLPTPVFLAFPSSSDGKAYTYNGKDLSSIPRLGRSLEEGMTTHSSILAWRIPMDRGTWKATIHMVTKSQTWLKRVRMHTQSGVRPDQWLSGLQTACKRGTQYFFLEILEGFNVNFSECSGLLRIAFTNSLGVLSSVLCGL